MDRRVVVVYKSDNNDMGRALARLEKELKEFKPTYISRERLLEHDTRGALVIVAGGDGTFLGASHRILDNYSLVLGVKLGEASKGYYAATDLKGLNSLIFNVLRRHHIGYYKVERLPRLECVMHTDSGNWVKTDLALNEFFIANTVAYLPSRYILRHECANTLRNVNEMQWSSGLIVCTSQGYSGWARHALGLEEDQKNPEIADSEFFYCVRESMNKEEMQCGMVRPGDRLFITSDMHRGYVVPDSFDEYHFNRGTEIEIRMSDRPLNVIRRVI